MHTPAQLDPETLLTAYAQGVFPMGDPDGVIRWYTADPRAASSRSTASTSPARSGNW